MRKIVSPPQFEKKLIKFLKKNPDLEIKISKIFSLLQKDVNHPLLKTHKLRGKYSLYFSSSITYEHRLIFVYDSDFVYLLTLGSHDDVY